MENPLEPKDSQDTKGKSFLSGMNTDGSESSSYIGKNIQFKGELVGTEDLHIEGKVEGSVTMGGQNLSIGGSGEVSANIHAQNVLINGTLNGDIFADDLIEVCKSAKVQGNLIAPRIKLEDGGNFRGTIDMVTNDQEKQERYESFKNKLLPNQPSQASQPATPAPKPSQAATASNSNASSTTSSFQASMNQAAAQAANKALGKNDAGKA